MASTYSTNLAIELIGTGDQAGSWGNTTNTNLGTLIEQAISGYVTQAVSTGTDTTITIPNGATGVARNMYIELTGTGGTNTNLIVPANKKLYFIFNNTSSGQVTVKVSGQTGVSVPNKAKMILVSNGTDIVDATNYIGNISAASANITVLTSASATITNLIATSASITTLTNNPTFSAGTANGVLYLNGSKVATSGSALTFDGTNLGIGVTPSYKLDVLGSGAAAAFRINNATAGKSAMLVQSNGATAGIIGLTGFVKGDSSTNLGFFAETGFDLRFYTNGSATEKAVIDTSGNLGIGTTTPGYKIVTSGSAQLYTSAAAIAFYDTAGQTTSRNWIIGNIAANTYGDLTFSNSTTAGGAPTTARMTIDYQGNVGIGTASPAAKLDVNGAGVVRGFLTATDAIKFGGNTSAPTSTDAFIYRPADNTLAFGTASAEKMRLNSSGNFGILTTTPQRPLHVFYNNAAVGEYTAILQGAQGGYGAGISFQSVLQGSSTLAEMCRITADGESAWSTTASTQDANLRFYTAIDGTVAERMRLTAGGLLSLWDVNGDKFQLNGLASNSYKLSKFTGGGQYGDGEFRITAGDTLAGAFTFSSGGTTRAIIDNTGNVGIGTVSPATKLHVYSGSGATSLKVQRTTVPTYLTDCATGASNAASVWSVNIQNTSNGSSSWASPDNSVYSCAAVTLDAPTAGSNILFSTASAVNTAPTERARITSAGELLIGQTAGSINVTGAYVTGAGQGGFCVSGSPCILVNRKTSDGTLVSFRQDDVEEGSISVSGTTVSYNGGHLSRWSQTADNTRIPLLKGTVMSNLDQMAVWEKDGQPLPNEQLNCMKVSDVEGDVNVAGVFVNWDNDDDESANDMNVAMTGDMIIRIAQGIVVQRGDLLMSAGDGTAKPQGDDIRRSKTIAKVTSNHVTCTYDDGSYCVPCVLMAC